MKLWEKQKNESAQAFEAAHLYFQMGAERSIDAVRKKLGKSQDICERWSARHNWRKRAHAYDQHLASIETKATEGLVKNRAKMWQERREQIREDGFKLYERLKAKAEQMLAFPLERRQTKDGQTIIEPAEWNFNTATRMLDVAVKLGRLSADLATEKIEIDERARHQIAVDAFIEQAEKQFNERPTVEQAKEYLRPVMPDIDKWVN